MSLLRREPEHHWDEESTHHTMRFKAKQGTEKKLSPMRKYKITYTKIIRKYIIDYLRNGPWKFHKPKNAFTDAITLTLFQRLL